jgi:hypothetical protein
MILTRHICYTIGKHRTYFIENSEKSPDQVTDLEKWNEIQFPDRPLYERLRHPASILRYFHGFQAAQQSTGDLCCSVKNTVRSAQRRFLQSSNCNIAFVHPKINRATDTGKTSHDHEIEEKVCENGHPVRSEYKLPETPDLLPRADALLIYPPVFGQSIP